MNKLLSLPLLAGLLLATTGCVEEVAYSRGPHHRPGYYDDRRSTTHYSTRPVYRGERRVYRDDGYYDRGEGRVYVAPHPRHREVRVGF